MGSVVWFMIYCTSSAPSNLLRTQLMISKGKDVLNFAEDFMPE